MPKTLTTLRQIRAAYTNEPERVAFAIELVKGNLPKTVRRPKALAMHVALLLREGDIIRQRSEEILLDAKSLLTS